MGTLIAFTIGYVFGSKGGRERYEEVAESIRQTRTSEEFRGMVSAVSSHLEHIVHEVGDRLTAPSPDGPAADGPPAPMTPAWATDSMDGTNGHRTAARASGTN